MIYNMCIYIRLYTVYIYDYICVYVNILYIYIYILFQFSVSSGDPFQFRAHIITSGFCLKV